MSLEPSMLERISPSLYRLADSCNAYLLVDGDTGLVIDPGSGAILDHLADAGVERVEWVLHTHHHRDQCWGTPRLVAHGARVAVPEHERHLFDQVELFWRTRRIWDNYDNRSTFFTLGESVAVDAVLEDYEEFTWRGHRLQVLPAKGHTFGSSALLAEIDGRRVAFTGDLITEGGRLYQLHAMEYMYSDLAGLAFTLQSIQALRRRAPELCLPSHGAPITDVAGDINRLERRIDDCVRLGRGMHVGGIWSPVESLFLPKLELHPISRHLLWGGVFTCSNFFVLLSESGKAMFVDYGHANLPHLHLHADHEGMESVRFVEHRLDTLFDDWGVSSIDLVVPTHIHDDHVCGIPYLQRHHGTRCYALDQVAEVISDPGAWASTPCIYPKPVRVDRVLADGERFRWEEYELEIHFAPGQTEFASVIAAEIDGRKIAFCGDNIWPNEVVTEGRRVISPHEQTVLRNSFQLWMHRRCAEVMRRVQPELVCPGHGELIPFFKPDLDAYCDSIAQKERVFRELVPAPADHGIDLFWARLLPYLATVEPGVELEYRLLLRNNLERAARYEVRLLPPPGWEAADAPAELTLGPDERGELRLRCRAPGRRDPIRRLLTAEIRIDGASQGPIAEALVSVGSAG